MNQLLNFVKARWQEIPITIVVDVTGGLTPMSVGAFSVRQPADEQDTADWLTNPCPSYR